MLIIVFKNIIAQFSRRFLRIPVKKLSIIIIMTLSTIFDSVDDFRVLLDSVAYYIYMKRIANVHYYYYLCPLCCLPQVSH